MQINTRLPANLLLCFQLVTIVRVRNDVVLFLTTGDWCKMPCKTCAGGPKLEQRAGKTFLSAPNRWAFIEGSSSFQGRRASINCLHAWSAAGLIISLGCVRRKCATKGENRPEKAAPLGLRRNLRGCGCVCGLGRGGHWKVLPRGRGRPARFLRLNANWIEMHYEGPPPSARDRTQRDSRARNHLSHWRRLHLCHASIRIKKWDRGHY